MCILCNCICNLITVFNICNYILRNCIFAVVFLRKRRVSYLFKNVSNFVLFLLFTCPWCTVISITCCIVLFFFFFFVVLYLMLVSWFCSCCLMCPWCTVISITCCCALFAWFCFGSLQVIFWQFVAYLHVHLVSVTFSTLLCWSFLFPTSNWITLPFSFICLHGAPLIYIICDACYMQCSLSTTSAASCHECPLINAVLFSCVNCFQIL